MIDAELGEMAMSVINRHAASAYGKAQNCVPQPWMVGILLKGVLDHLAGARTAYANGRRAEGVRRATKAVAILQGLRDNLRPEISARLTGRLDQFYGTAVLRIADLMKTGFDDEVCSQVMANIKVVHDAWSTIDERGDGRA